MGFLTSHSDPWPRRLGPVAGMLVYYFGSKEELLVEAIEVIRGRMQADFLREISEGGGIDKHSEAHTRAVDWAKVGAV